MSSLSTLPKGDSAWLLRKSIQRVMQQVSVLETNIGSSTTGNSANTQIIFNDAGTLRGDAQFTWNKTLNRLTVDGDETITGDLTINNAATISGDLTVDTSTLKVDSTNNRVGIGTASPAQSLDVASGNLQVRTGGTVISDTFSNYGAALSINAAGGLPLRLQIGGTNAYEITSGNIHTWSNVGGVSGTAMTLNSTGLGVGGGPTRKLSIIGSGATFANIGSGDNTSLVGLLLGGTSTPSAGQVIYDNTANSLALFTLGTSRLLIDSSGNVGVGVSTFGTSAAKVLGLANATAPSTSPAGMGQLYVESGALKFRGSSGTITTIAAA